MFTELELERSHTYKDIIEIAANYFQLDGSNFILYRPRGGALILHKDLSLMARLFLGHWAHI